MALGGAPLSLVFSTTRSQLLQPSSVSELTSDCIVGAVEDDELVSARPPGSTAWTPQQLTFPATDHRLLACPSAFSIARHSAAPVESEPISSPATIVPWRSEQLSSAETARTLAANMAIRVKPPRRSCVFGNQTFPAPVGAGD